MLVLFAVTAVHADERTGSRNGNWFPKILTEEGTRAHYLPDFSYAGYH